MAGIKWTFKENEFLLNNYENMKTCDILNGLPLRSWDAIKIKAEKLKLRRYYNQNRFANLDILLSDINETYYWIGFIMADGNIINNRLRIGLSVDDDEHLNKFKKFINYERELRYYTNNGYKCVGISVKDTKYLKKLCDKFNIDHDKTHSPCDIKNINSDDLLLSLIIGFIDGDGCMKNQSRKRKDFRLNINCHKSWYSNLEYMLETIFRMIGEKCETSVKYTKNEKYAFLGITKTSVLKKLKHKMLMLNVPYLKRKWDVINMDFESKYEIRRKRLEQYINIINNEPNMKIKDISKILNLSEGTIYKYRKKI